MVMAPGLGQVHGDRTGTKEFFLNGVKFSLKSVNSANSENLINHCSMN